MGLEISPDDSDICLNPRAEIFNPQAGRKASCNLADTSSVLIPSADITIPLSHIGNPAYSDISTNLPVRTLTNILDPNATVFIPTYRINSCSNNNTTSDVKPINSHNSQSILNPNALEFIYSNKFEVSYLNTDKSLDDQNSSVILHREGSNLDTNDESAYLKLKRLKLKHFNRIIVVHLNINIIRNKFDVLSDLIKGYIDILLV